VRIYSLNIITRLCLTSFVEYRPVYITVLQIYHFSIK
jgi:hypothetical protein